MVLLFMDEIYRFHGCSSDGLNSQALFLSCQLILVALHGLSFHLGVVYISDSVELIILHAKRNIPLDIII